MTVLADISFWTHDKIRQVRRKIGTKRKKRERERETESESECT